MAQNDSELREKLDEKLETLLGFLGERDDSDNWWGFDTNVGTLEDKMEEALDGIMHLITAYKDKAVEEVLDRFSLPIILRLDDDEEYISVGELNLMLDAERYRLKGEK